MKKITLTEEEKKAVRDINEMSEKRKTIHKQYRDIEGILYKSNREFVKNFKTRLRNHLKELKKTLPKKNKAGFSLTYKMTTYSGHVPGYGFVYDIPRIETTVQPKKIVKKSKISSDLERIIDDMGYRLVKK